MNPDTNIAEQQELANELMDAEYLASITAEEVAAKTFRLAELVLALDVWLAAGGRIPRRWATELPEGEKTH